MIKARPSSLKDESIFSPLQSVLSKRFWKCVSPWFCWNFGAAANMKRFETKILHSNISHFRVVCSLCLWFKKAFQKHTFPILLKKICLLKLSENQHKHTCVHMGGGRNGNMVLAPMKCSIVCLTTVFPIWCHPWQPN